MVTILVIWGLRVLPERYIIIIMLRRALVRRQSKVPALRRDHFVIPVAGFLLVTSLMASVEILPWNQVLAPIIGFSQGAYSRLVVSAGESLDFLTKRLSSSNREIDQTMVAVSTRVQNNIFDTTNKVLHIGSTVDRRLDETKEITYSASKGVASLTTTSAEKTKKVLTDANLGSQIVKERSFSLAGSIIAGVDFGFENIKTKIIEIGRLLGRLTKNIWLAVSQKSEPILVSAGNLADDLRHNWIVFLGGQDEAPAQVIPSTIITETDPELIKEIVRKELARLQAEGALPNQGVVVVPATGDKAQDELIKKELSNSFSDEVKIQFDSTGRTGVVTPIFRSTLGADYLFILTPLRR